jgi:hypothetical protein
VLELTNTEGEVDRPHDQCDEKEDRHGSAGESLRRAGGEGQGHRPGRGRLRV